MSGKYHPTNIHQHRHHHRHSTDPEIVLKSFWLTDCFPSLWKEQKEKKQENGKTFTTRFPARLFGLGSFFFFFLSSFSWILAHTSTCHQALPNITASDPPAPHPTLLLPAKLQKVRTWLRTRGCGGRCSARSLRSPFWCGTPGRTPAEETQNRSLSTFKILQTISSQRSETGGVVEN